MCISLYMQTIEERFALYPLTVIPSKEMENEAAFGEECESWEHLSRNWKGGRQPWRSGVSPLIAVGSSSGALCGPAVNIQGHMGSTAARAGTERREI